MRGEDSLKADGPEATLQEIAELTKVAAEPEPTPAPKPARKRIRPVTVADAVLSGGELVPDDDDDVLPDVPTPTPLDEHGALVAPPPAPVTPGSLYVPAPRYSPEGFPCVESCQVVKARRANYAVLVEKWTEAKAKVTEAAGTFGLDARRLQPGDTDRVAAELLARGEAVADIDDLDALARQERRLAAAATIAAKEVEPAVASARSRMAAEVNARLKPTCRAFVLSQIAMIRAAVAHRREVEKVGRQQFPISDPYHIVGGQYSANPGDAKPGLDRLIALGVITPDDVKDLYGG